MRDPAVGARRPTRTQLRGQVGAVVRDLPALMTAPPYRSRHLVWGATRQEQLAEMPGDGVLMEFGDLAMLRAMLRGIKQRAEGLDRASREIESQP